MEIIQTVGTILFAMSALGFLFLAVFDQPLGNRQRVHTSSEIESGFGIPAAVRLLRASHAKLKLAFGERRLDEVGRDARDLEKVA